MVIHFFITKKKNEPKKVGLNGSLLKISLVTAQTKGLARLTQSPSPLRILILNTIREASASLLNPLLTSFFLHKPTLTHKIMSLSLLYYNKIL